MSCCPPNSAPSFLDDYSPSGSVIDTGGTSCYSIGTATAGGKAIVMIPDIWGWNSGRIRRVADMLSVGTDSYILIPKLLEPSFEGGTDGDALPPDFNIGGPRGAECWPWLAQFRYSDVVKPKLDAVFAHLKDLNIGCIGMVGFCWGGWVQAHVVNERPDIACLVTPHPSIHSCGGLHGENHMELVSNVSKEKSLMLKY